MLTKIDAQAAAQLVQDGALLVDVREADEFARARVDGAHNQPLSRLDGAVLRVAPGQAVVFMCQSGMRTANHAAKLAGLAEGCEAYLLDGGLSAWQGAGQPVTRNRSQPLPLMRQVQIAAGGLALAGAVLGFAVAPAFHAVPAVVGAGLVFAGITGTCGMAQLLMRMPWNRAAA